MTKWWHVSWKRVIIALLVVFASLWAVAEAVTYIAYQVEPWFLVRNLAHSDPRLNVVPVPLPDNGQVALGGVRIELLGFSLQTPWKEILKEKDGRGFSYVAFNDGGIVSVFNKPDEISFANLLRSDPRIVHLVGQEALRSEYALTAAAMVMTPEQAKWWNDRRQNGRILFLLGRKELYVQENGPIYSVASGNLRGFQEGNPTIAPYQVKLDLFDPDDHHYEIRIAGGIGHGPVLSQAQINAMLASFKPIARK